MEPLLSTVTDLELQASQVVKFILLALLLLAAGFNIREFFKATRSKTRALRAGLVILFLLICFPISRQALIEGSLLLAPEYSTGKTLGFCEIFAKGKAIEFEYEVEGRIYKNCNSYHPVPLSEIIVPDGNYKVRYSLKYPDKGRIDFNDPIE